MAAVGMGGSDVSVAAFDPRRDVARHKEVKDAVNRVGRYPASRGFRYGIGDLVGASGLFKVDEDIENRGPQIGPLVPGSLKRASRSRH